MHAHPFSDVYSDEEDSVLIEQAQKGSRLALTKLIKRHQHYIYTLALKMVLSPQDAEDLTQEVLVKVITKLSQFQGKSAFRTWLYRITFNHFLQMKERPMEQAIQGFEAYGEGLDTIPDEDMGEVARREEAEFIYEANISCMSGMLLCLSREQRLTYILGEILNVTHTQAAELLGISKDNYRQRLVRARRDLYQFMNAKCGLVNQQNPCRCARKTRGFIKAGWVNPKTLQFQADHRQRIQDVLPQKAEEMADLVEQAYAGLFRAHPFQEKPHVDRLLRQVLDDPDLRQTFLLEE